MEKIKLLLYCTKRKPYLYNPNKYKFDFINQKMDWEYLNGKIVAECDFEVKWWDTSWYCSDFIEHKGLEKSCLTKEQLFDYVKGRNGFYAIHIKNLNIFDKPKGLWNYAGLTNKDITTGFLEKAPQNMMKVIDEYGNKYILISIRAEWLCKILNGEKTIEIRKKVLKEMI